MIHIRRGIGILLVIFTILAIIGLIVNHAAVRVQVLIVF